MEIVTIAASTVTKKENVGKGMENPVRKRKKQENKRANQAAKDQELVLSNEDEQALVTLEPLPNEEEDLCANLNRVMEQWKCNSEEDPGTQEMAFGPAKLDKKEDNSMWLGDTGASCHMTNSIQGLVNLVPKKTWIIFGNGQRL